MNNQRKKNVLNNRTVFLLYPPIFEADLMKLLSTIRGLWELPYYLLELYSYLISVKNIKVEFEFSERMTLSDICDKIRGSAPYVLIFYTPSLKRFYSGIKIILKLIDEKIKPHFIIFTGYFPVMFYEKILRTFKFINFILLKEENVKKIIDYLINGYPPLETIDGIAYLNKNAKFIYRNMPQIPAILNKNNIHCHWVLTNDLIKKSNLMEIQSSKGCIGNCTFCIVNAENRTLFGKNLWIPKAPEDTLSEIEEYLKKIDDKKTHIIFIDENFLVPTQENISRINHLLKGFKRLNKKLKKNFSWSIKARPNDVLFFKDYLPYMRTIGLKSIFMGVESIIKRQQLLFNKIIKKEIIFNSIKTLRNNKIDPIVSYILFDPLSSKEEIKESIKFLKWCDKLKCGINSGPLILYPGTYITEYLLQNNLSMGDLFKGYLPKYKNEEVKILADLWNKLDRLFSLAAYYMGCSNRFQFYKFYNEIFNFLIKIFEDVLSVPTLSETFVNSIVEENVEKITYYREKNLKLYMRKAVNEIL